jgi:tetratricopeptide (TPR) repeat protein
MGTASLRLLVVALACCLALGLPRQAAAAPCDKPVGRLVSIQGIVEVSPADRIDWRPARLDEPLCAGWTIRVGNRSRAEAALVDQPKFRIDQNSTLRLIEVPEQGTSMIDQLTGAVYYFSRRPRRLRIDTPFVNAAIEGTEFLVRVDAERTLITVFEGTVVAANEQGRLVVPNGESAVAAAGQPPKGYVLVRPRDAVQWALYYPPLLLLPGGRAAAGTGAQTPALADAAALAERGDFAAAFARFDAVPDAERDAEFHLFQAATLLAVGRAEDAEADIDRVLGLDAGNSRAYALRSVIAVTRNDTVRALADARHALDLDPRSAAARIALSYALQADFAITAARDALRQAVADEPDNALAWARLAELSLAAGERRDAAEAAARARDLAPELDLVQTVYGFAALGEIRTRAAKAAFNRAIATNSANPLPRFGLGLAKIRDGDVSAGRSDIEIAVALDPERSLLRSYLGKAYDEDRITSPAAYVEALVAQVTGGETSLAGQQYAIAKELDPADPTPWFYDALLKQSENRPVEALHDLQRSIALNDNRAPVRSRQLLVSDRAGRGASLARIYNDLGFERLGINEATQSLALDPSNPAAHRFLSDVYAGQPRREIARVSELLQAQLLQDININPIQPRLSATGLNIVNAGPFRFGLNEYTPLFERNQAQLNLSGEIGNHSTLAGEAVGSAVYDRFSLSAGHFDYNTDGFRRNNDLKHEVTNVFAQAALTPELNVQTELFRQRTENGDIALDFDPEDYSRSSRTRLDEDFARLGVRYSPSSVTDVLGSVIFSDTDERQVGARLTADGWQAETEVLTRGEIWNLTTGFASYQQNRDLRLDFLPDQPGLDVTQYSGFAYGVVRFPDPLAWTIGLSIDDFDQENVHEFKLNPKFGAQWNVTEKVRLKAAVFRSLKPALIGSRTIQPTQVAGFNQFFDDPAGTESWNYAVGADVRLTETVYSGAEYTHRSLQEPAFDVIAGTFDRFDADEDIIRGYLYYTPHPFWAVGGEVVYDIFDTESEPVPGIPTQAETLSLPVSLRFFHPSGLFSAITATFVHQDVSAATDEPEGHDSFFLLDAGIGFQLPQRRGRISFEAINILDSKFDYLDDDYRTFDKASYVGPFIPERTYVGRLTLNF